MTSYEDNSSIPKRGLPLNGWAAQSMPGGAGAFSPTEQWGSQARRAHPIASIPLYGIPQEPSGVPPIITDQWGAIPKDGFVLGSVPYYGIPQHPTDVPPIPPEPIPDVSGGGGGEFALLERERRRKKRFELRERILRDDEEILLFVSLIVAEEENRVGLRR